MTTYSTISKSKQDGAPVNLFIFSGAADSEFVAERLIRSVCLIPGTTEFGYGTTTVKKVEGGIHENSYAGGEITDFVRSMEQLLERAPNLVHVSVVVAWHGDDLRIGNCTVKPKVDRATKNTTPYSWQVGPTTRSTAELVSYIAGQPAAGGAPSDRSVYECITWLKSKGLAVTVYPFILMDVEAGNSLPNPYGGTGQPAYPWRGRITCYPAPGYPGTVDQTAAAATQVANFFGTVNASHFGWNNTTKTVTYSGPSNEWSFRRHILHLATIADAAGADDFLIGTEMVEMNRIRSARSTFPAVDQLIDLLGECRSILGSGVKISYAADWSEWNGYRPGDGTGDIHFHLDKLWADPDIDYIGIDNYMKLSDWRDGLDHLDAEDGWQSIYDLNYLRSNVEGGEDYDFYYASQGDRNNQIRSPISDGGYNKPWVYRQKDLRNWWKNTHIHRIDGVETTASAWVPESKPITFTELGCSATNRGANQPNVFVDPKSSENGFPYYSKQVRDDLMQRAFLEAELSYWEANNEPGMLDLDRISIWAWDARPYPDFPEADDFWGDAANWEYGHWLNGRLQIPNPVAGTMETFRYTSAAKPIEYGGFTYTPLPIKPGRVKNEGSLERSSFEVMVPRDGPLAMMFRQFRSAHPMVLTILQGHLTDGSMLFVPRWHGRITSTKRKGEELQVLGIPSAAALARAGLTRNYQIGCPHVLYGPLCRASRDAATVIGTVSDIDGAQITLNPGWNAQPVAKYVTGYVEWTRVTSQIERRRILAASGNVLTLSGPPTELDIADSVKVVLGCGQTVQDCRDLHSNIQNCGACPTIPTKNPMGSNTNNFY